MDDLRNFMISVLTPDSEYDETVLDSLSEEEILNFYRIYQRNMENMAEIYGKTPVQKVFLEKMYDGISLPLQYEAYGAWDTILLYVETYSILLAIVVGFLCAGIFADDFQTKADAVFFATKYGRTKAIKIKILAGMVITTVLYVSGMGVLSVICFGVMGVSGGNTPYQIAQAYSIYHMTYSQYYLLAVACGYIACLQLHFVCWWRQKCIPLV